MCKIDKAFLKAPFTYMGGKTAVAHKIWAALGNVKHYIEPFFGSGSVLLNRPIDQWDQTETVNDADGHIANVWRSIQLSPDDVAKYCDYPVNHIDMSARRSYMIDNYEGLKQKLLADPEYHDPKLAGYWVYCAAIWIGGGMTIGKNKGDISQIPHISDAGKGINSIGKRPHISDAGKNINTQSKVGSIRQWMSVLSSRLRRVRVVCGDWSQVCGGDWQSSIGTVGIFFDPPYSDTANRCDNIYSEDSLSVAHDVREWCIKRGSRDDHRIVLAGYYEEHVPLIDHGWRVERWSTNGGYANLNSKDSQGKKNKKREALFYSPHCLNQQPDLLQDIKEL